MKSEIVTAGAGPRAVSAEILGRGPSLVMFHSLLADRGSFARIAPALAARFRVVMPDLPGFGGSAPAPGGMAAIADRMAEAIATLCPGEAPILLGNGFGAFAALQLAIRHPARLTRLVLADGGAAFSEPGRQAFRNMAAAAAARGLAAITDIAMRRLFAPAFQEENPALMAERRAAFLRTDTGVFADACATLAGLDLRAAAAGMRLPALVLAGEQDEATPPAMSIELAGLLPNARLAILPGLAHVPQMQAPEVFLAAVEAFLGVETPAAA